MLNFDELLKMTDEERTTHLRLESDKVIDAAPKNRQLKLRWLQSQCNKINRTTADPLEAAREVSVLMTQHLNKLEQEVRKL